MRFPKKSSVARLSTAILGIDERLLRAEEAAAHIVERVEKDNIELLEESEEVALMRDGREKGMAVKTLEMHRRMHAALEASAVAHQQIVDVIRSEMRYAP